MAQLAAETWTGTTGAAWPAQWSTTGALGTQTIQSNAGQMVTGTGVYATARRLISALSASSMDATVTFTWPTGSIEQYLFVYLRHNNAWGANAWEPAAGYALRFGASGTTVSWEIDKGAGTGASPAILTSGTFTTPTVATKIRFQAIGGTVRFKVWAASGSEPATWTGTVTDGSPAAAGTIGLAYVNGGDGVSRAVTFDDLTVTDGTTASTYYVAANGSDTANGLSTATPFATISKVNGLALSPGDSVLFRGGDTFTGEVYVGTGGTAASPITFGSYGTGRATITNSTGHGFNVYNAAGLVIKDLLLAGTGTAFTNKSGISLYKDSAGRADYVQISNVESYGWQFGVSVGGTTGGIGFSNVTATGCVFRNNRDDGFISYGPSTFAGAYSHSNITVVGCSAYDNEGNSANTSSHSGSGIILGSVDGGLIDQCAAYSNGSLNAAASMGPVGLWAYDANAVVISRSVSYDNHSGTSADGGGFDLDMNVSNSRIEYCLAYNNDGAGILLFGATTNNNHTGNVVRYNLLRGNGRSAGNYGDITFYGNVRSSSVYGNTAVSVTNGTVQPSPIWITAGTPSGNTVRNNIFQVRSTASVVKSTTALASTAVLFQGNAYHSTGTLGFTWGGSTYGTLTAWRAAAANQEMVSGSASGFVGDPLLVNPGIAPTVTDPTATTGAAGLALQATSPVAKAGLDLATLFGTSTGTRDYFGSTLTAPYSIGGAEQDTAAPVSVSLAGAGTLSATATPTRTVSATLSGSGTLAATAASGSLPYFKGINAHPVWFGSDKIDPLINDAAANGVATMRIDIPWGYYETAKGVYDPTWQANLDYFMSKATAVGIDVLPVVTGCPGWANGGQDNGTPPTNTSDYADFVQYVIQRWTAIKAVQIWDEPDGSWAWTQAGTDAQRAQKYVTLLQAAYNRVKAVRPSVLVTGPTLSNYTTTPVAWLNAFYAAGGKAYKDVGSYHFYGDPPQHGNLTPEALIDAWLAAIWPIIQSNGDAGQELWLTETGYSTDPAGVTEAVQADYLTRMYAAVRTKIPTATRLYWYSFSNDADGSTDPEANYGITKFASTGTGSSAHFTAKPALAAFKAVPVPGGSTAVTRAAALSGSGTLSVTAATSRTVSAPLSGAGSLTVTATKVGVPTVAAALAGSGALTVTATKVGVPTVSVFLAGSGTLSAGVAQPTATVPTAVGGGGMLSAATQVRPTTRAVALAGLGSLSGAFSRPSITATLSGSGLLVVFAGKVTPVLRATEPIWFGSGADADRAYNTGDVVPASAVSARPDVFTGKVTSSTTDRS